MADLQKERRVGPLEKAVWGVHLSEAPWQGTGQVGPALTLEPLVKSNVVAWAVSEERRHLFPIHTKQPDRLS